VLVLLSYYYFLEILEVRLGSPKVPQRTASGIAGAEFFTDRMSLWSPNQQCQSKHNKETRLT